METIVETLVSVNFIELWQEILNMELGEFFLSWCLDCALVFLQVSLKLLFADFRVKKPKHFTRF